MTTTLVEEMAAARLEWTSTQIMSWYPRQDLLTQLRTSLKTQADWVGNEAFGSQVRDDVATGGMHDPLAWANRRLELPARGWVITGIRYRGRNITRPFIDVIATTAPPTLGLIAQTIVPAYAPFRPLCFRVQVADAADLLQQTRSDHRFGVGCAVDMHVIAGTLTYMKMQALPWSYRGVRLNPADPAVLAQRANTIYRQLAQQNPETTLWATPENVDSLGACAEEGMLFEVTVDGAPAGVVAAARHDAHGMRGFSVDELCLDQTHRGNGLAQAVLRHLVERLPHAAGDVLWGTIHPSNAPSLRNALSMGRRQVATDVWITPSDLSGMPTTSRPSAP